MKMERGTLWHVFENFDGRAANLWAVSACFYLERPEGFGHPAYGHRSDRSLQLSAFKKPEQENGKYREYENDDPMIDAGNLGEVDLSVIPDGNDIGLGKGVGDRVEAAPTNHSQNAPEGVKSAFSHCTDRRSRAIAQKTPADTEQGPTDQLGTQRCRFHAQLDQAQVFEQIDPDRSNDNRAQHEFDDGHIDQSQGPHLLVVPQYMGFLQEKAEDESRDDPIKQAHVNFPFIR